MRFISSCEMHEKWERKRKFGLWRTKSANKKQGIAAMERSADLRATRRALTSLIYAFARSRTLRGIEIWVQRKSFRKLVSYWKHMSLSDEVPTSISSADLLIMKRNKALKRHGMARMQRNLLLSRACIASDSLIEQKKRSLSKNVVQFWFRKVLRIARSERVSRIMYCRQCLSKLSLLFRAWLQSSKKSRWFRRCFSSIKFKQVLFLLEICCHGWRLVALNVSRNKKISDRIKQQRFLNEARTVARHWSLLVTSRRESGMETRDAVRLSNERRGRSAFSWWAFLLARRKAAEVAEARSKRKRALHVMRTLLLSWSSYSRALRRTVRITKYKATHNQAAFLGHTFSIWARFWSTKTTRQHRVLRISKSHNVRLQSDYLQQWISLWTIIKKAKSMCTVSIVRVLSNVIFGWILSVRNKRRIHTRAQLGSERRQLHLISHAFHSWLTLSISLRRLRRAFQRVNQRATAKTLEITIFTWRDTSMRRVFIKKALNSHLNKRSTAEAAQYFEIWFLSSRSSRDIMKTENTCKSR